MQQWSFDIQRQVMSDATVSAGYVGSKGTAPDRHRGYQSGSSGSGCRCRISAGRWLYHRRHSAARLNILRPYRGYNAINAIMSAFNSNYHSVQTSFDKRFKKSGNIQFAYTWSKNLTDNGSDRSNAPQNTYNWHADYGRATLDRRHVLTLSYVYPLPFLREGSTGPLKYVAGGWEISGIFTYNSGLPIDGYNLH